MPAPRMDANNASRELSVAGNSGGVGPVPKSSAGRGGGGGPPIAGSGGGGGPPIRGSGGATVAS